jgi:hypothetical protein
MSKNPYVFIVGCPRSGTTLLRRLVDAHPQIAITPETQWIPRFFKRQKGISSQGLVTSKLIDRLIGHRRFCLLGIGRDELVALLKARQPISYADFISGVFDLYGLAQGKQLVGDKTSGYVRNLQVLHELWPAARFVHIIRDGRDVCLSVVSWSKADRATGFLKSWRDDPISTAALWWSCNVHFGREVGQKLGAEQYCEIRYELLVAHAAVECAKLCDFLDVPYHDAMPHFYERRPAAATKMEADHAWLPVTSGLRDWRTQMSEVDVARFEAVAGDLLETLSYERAAKNLPLYATRYAHEFRRAFAEDALTKQWRLPQSW